MLTSSTRRTPGAPSGCLIPPLAERERTGRGGFTLIETIVALLLVAVVSGM